MRTFLRALCWVGLAFSIFLIGAGIYAHFTMEPLMRIFFVFIPVGGGLLIGLWCLGYLITGKWQ
jgi:hypothetical protein